MRCASISVGIVNYAERYYRESAMHLQFAASDADAFFQYASNAFPKSSEGSVHQLLIDNHATIENITTAFGRVNESTEFDIFLLYLSGHGEREANGKGWFCLVDARQGIASLNSSLLDDWLSRIKAKKVIVIIDCCYAEAIFFDVKFFLRLGSAEARLLIASARADQRAWEDATLSRSVFSDVLLRACSNTSSIQNSSGQVDVEASLFPYLRDQVMLLTAKNKRGEVQEPVTGGLAITSLRLRTVSGKTFGRSLTLAETLRSRIRRILVSSSIVILITFAAVHGITFHLAAGTNGQILVRLGLYSSTGVLPPYLVSQIDSGLKLSDIDPSSLSGLTVGSLILPNFGCL